MKSFAVQILVTALITSGLASAHEEREVVTTYTTISYCLDPVWKTATTTALVPGKTKTVNLPYTSTETDLYYSLSGYAGAWPATPINPTTDPYTTSTYVAPVYKCTGTYSADTATTTVTVTKTVPTKTATVTQWAGHTTVTTTSVLANYG